LEYYAPPFENDKAQAWIWLQYGHSKAGHTSPDDFRQRYGAVNIEAQNVPGAEWMPPRVIGKL
jgi:hypothetical protein